MSNSQVSSHRLSELIAKADFVVVNGQLIISVLPSFDKAAKDLYLIAKNCSFGVDGNIRVRFNDHQPVEVDGFCGFRTLPERLLFEFYIKRKLRLTDLE